MTGSERGPPYVPSADRPKVPTWLGHVAFQPVPAGGGDRFADACWTAGGMTIRSPGGSCEMTRFGAGERSAVVFDGYLYDRGGLAADMELALARASNARLAAACWTRWGPATFERLRGGYLLAVYDVMSEAVERAYSGEGTTLVEAKTYRLVPHSSDDDDRSYRSREEVEEWKQKDPILRFQNYLMQEGLLNDDLLHDYDRRLEWDTLLSAAYLADGHTRAELGATSVCVGRSMLGRMALKTVYVTFDRPRLAAVKMVNAPPLFASWAASIRHDELGPTSSRLIYTWSFAARPRWLAGGG